MLQLHRPSSGRVWLGDIELTALGENELRGLRPRMQMIFQDSYSSLNPRHTVGRIVGEPMRVHTDMTARQVTDRVIELLDLVGYGLLTEAATPTSSPAVSASASTSPGRWLSAPT